jgi:hypothetical protein
MKTPLPTGEVTAFSPSPTRTADPSPQSDETPWKLIIERADGSTQIIESVTSPIVCDQRDEPRIISLCADAMVNGQRIAVDFIQVNLDAGESYSIEGPPTPLPIEDGTPTPTVIGPTG